ncbi:GNAT family N-acetyltransferase [Leifsonia sp. AG29]|uniref:GNAT family N-acetyltransferase n=1 Tax=Leifsonia sp. AG29 TaxID=2598860 RepID=UPI00131A9F39|nr:GNAT family N-acetyltransferase [Leifsonia sp. AG29]
MSAPFRVLDAAVAADRQVWLEQWSEWPDREVQAHPSYVSLFADGDDRALAASWNSDAGTVLFPFVLRTIRVGEARDPGDALSDIVTPYGYGGAFSWNAADRADLAARFWAAFADWASDHRVVSEFLRLSLFEESVLPYPGALEHKQDNIVVDVSLIEDDLWRSFDHKVRKNVNKARRSGIRIEVDETGARFAEFARIYESTMERRSADRGYYFEPDFFDSIHRGLPGHFAYFHALDGETVVSTELVLLSSNSGYSFLGGTREESFASRPNDLLKVEIMRWLAQTGRRWFVLGGGYQAGDGIFRYKRAFAPEGVRPFTVGTRVVDPDVYGALTRDRFGGAVPEDIGYFPAYRAAALVSQTADQT